MPIVRAKLLIVLVFLLGCSLVYLAWNGSAWYWFTYLLVGVALTLSAHGKPQPVSRADMPSLLLRSIVAVGSWLGILVQSALWLYPVLACLLFSFHKLYWRYSLLEMLRSQSILDALSRR